MSQPIEPILPGATLGVLGGGQLGRMFVHAAQRMGYFTAVLDPDEASPAGRVSHQHLRAPYLDADALAQLAGCCAAITTEFENVPAASLSTLALERPVAPGADAVAVAQDRALEKEHFARSGVACGPWARIEDEEQLQAVCEDRPELLPGILKTARLGYDGKGQALVEDASELAAAWDALGKVPCVLEQRLALAFEFSVVLARGRDGAIVHFPPQRNLHRGGILAVTEVFEQNVPSSLVQQSLHAAFSIANSLNYVGVLCVEFFALAPGCPEFERLGPLVANEMAPRPHNSGHYTIDACDVSQFDLQVRALAGLPLAKPRQHSPAIMLNLLGDLWLDQTDVMREPPWSKVLALPGAHLHLYGKTRASRGRKMGHLTLTAPSIEAVRATALQAAALLGIEAF
ncbi:MAG: 5-(carboxyamino)imidazole ribonucleotide synthase [Burkholderiales bacterium]